MTTQILIRLPEDIATRFRAVVPSRQRNKFVADLVRVALERQEASLAKIAEQVNEDERSNPELIAEDRDWNITIADGLVEAHGKRTNRPKTKTR
jgi:hypothetical protein